MGSILKALGLPMPASKIEAARAMVAAGKDATLWGGIKKRAKEVKHSVDELTKAYESGKKEVLKPVTEPLDHAEQAFGAGYGNEDATGSAVAAGVAEQSFKAFADDVKSVKKRLRQAQGVLAKLKGESTTAKAIGETADALGEVAEGLDKVGKGAGKVLEVAAAARKLEECRRVLQRVDAVDFTKTENRIENAKAIGDLAKLFGEFGAEASKEVPFLEGYFRLVSRMGEIWVPIAKMTDRREREWIEASESHDRVVAAPEPKGIAADTGEVIALDDVPAFLDRMAVLMDSKQLPREARQANDIRNEGRFDEHFAAFRAAIERSHGVKQKMLHAIADNTPVELPGERFLQEELAEHWKACRAVVSQLEDELERWNWIGVTYQPAVRAIVAARPKKG